MHRILPCFMCGLVLMLDSCNFGPSLIPVKGRVTLDGVPLEKGLVHFEAVDGKASSAKGGIIVNGDYSAEVPAGELRVKITSTRVVRQKKLNPDMPDSKMIDEEEQIVPKKYNDDTTLKVTVQSRRDDLDFLLKK